MTYNYKTTATRNDLVIEGKVIRIHAKGLAKGHINNQIEDILQDLKSMVPNMDHYEVVLESDPMKR